MVPALTQVAATGKQLDAETKSMQETIEDKMQHFGRDQTLGTVEKVKELLASERFKHT